MGHHPTIAGLVGLDMVRIRDQLEKVTAGKNFRKKNFAQGKPVKDLGGGPKIIWPEKSGIAIL